MTSIRRSAARALSAIESLAERRLGLLVLFACAIAVYSAHAFAWPLRAGRDLDEYLQYYVQILDAHPPLPAIMLGRTPLTPIMDGVVLDLWSGHLAEPMLAVLYASSIVAWFCAARVFGPRTALAVAVLLVANPAYGALFHDVSSEPVFATGFAIWSLLLVRAVTRPSAAALAAVGTGVAVLALVRPANQALVLIALFPLLMPGGLKTRLSQVGIVAIAAVVPLAAWALVNGLRYGEYTVARGGGAAFFHRSFVVDGDVALNNGPATRKLARAIQDHLLTRNPYKAYGVTLEKALASKSLRVADDIDYLAYEVWGWDGGPPVVSAAGREAVLAHPGTYAKNVLDTLWQETSDTYYRYIPPVGAGSGGASNGDGAGRSGPVVVKGVRLPRPSEGDVIPGGQNSWIARPDHGIRVVWTSPTDYRFAFANARLASQFQHVDERLGELFDAFPTRSANHGLAIRLNQLEHRYPRPFVWLLLGVVALGIRRPPRSLALLAPTLAGFVVALATAMAVPADLRYVIPMTPALILLAAGALLAPRRTIS